MLNIQTFDARAGGNVIYKAFAHPLAAEAVVRLAGRIGAGPLAVYDPDGVADALWAMNPAMPQAAESFVHDVQTIGQTRAGVPARPLTDLPGSTCRTLLVAAFDAGRIRARIAHMVPAGMGVLTLDEVRLPRDMLTNPARYLDRLKRIEGQARGISKMIDDEKYCIDILTQISAVTSALERVALGLLDDHLRHCVTDAARAGSDEADAKLAEASQAIARLVRS